ncbi:ricin B lectin domain-containing protein [Mycena olivaceomarginata]|nr:ricin B lectin domain-containing protein [Mycena olivaceomarginata]
MAITMASPNEPLLHPGPPSSLHLPSPLINADQRLAALLLKLNEHPQALLIIPTMDKVSTTDQPVLDLGQESLPSERNEKLPVDCSDSLSRQKQNACEPLSMTGMQLGGILINDVCISSILLLSPSTHSCMSIITTYLPPSFDSHVLPPSPNQSVKLQTVLGSGENSRCTSWSPCPSDKKELVNAWPRLASQTVLPSLLKTMTPMLRPSTRGYLRAARVYKASWDSTANMFDFPYYLSSADSLFETGSTIEWAGGSNNKCVDVTDGNLANGNQVQIWDCDENNSNQKFNAIPTTFPKWFTIELDHIAGNCITAENTVNASVVISTCTNEATGQRFTDPSNIGQMALYDNLCVTPAGNGLSDGTKLVLAPCEADNAAQIWSHQTGIINSHSFAKAVFERERRFMPTSCRN